MYSCIIFKKIIVFGVRRLCSTWLVKQTLLRILMYSHTVTVIFCINLEKCKQYFIYMEKALQFLLYAYCYFTIY